jgi:hypothetical protein
MWLQMPECRRKVSPASTFLSVVSSLSHSGIRVQSGTAGHGLVRHCLALQTSYKYIILSEKKFQQLNLLAGTEKKLAKF